MSDADSNPTASSETEYGPMQKTPDDPSEHITEYVKPGSSSDPDLLRKERAQQRENLKKRAAERGMQLRSRKVPNTQTFGVSAAVPASHWDVTGEFDGCGDNDKEAKSPPRDDEDGLGLDDDGEDPPMWFAAMGLISIVFIVWMVNN